VVAKPTRNARQKSNFCYTRLIPYLVSRVSGAHVRGFAPRPTHQGYNGGESLATCGRFDRLEIWTLFLPNQKQTSLSSGQYAVHIKHDVVH